MIQFRMVPFIESFHAVFWKQLTDIPLLTNHWNLLRSPRGPQSLQLMLEGELRDRKLVNEWATQTPIINQILHSTCLKQLHVRLESLIGGPRQHCVSYCSCKKDIFCILKYCYQQVFVITRVPPATKLSSDFCFHSFPSFAFQIPAETSSRTKSATMYHKHC